MAAGHVGARQIKDQPNRRCGNRTKAGGKGRAVNGLAQGLDFNLKFPFACFYFDLVKRVLDIAPITNLMQLRGHYICIGQWFEKALIKQ